MKKFYSLLAGGAIVAFASTAFAAPLQLSDRQLDVVTAGGTATAHASAMAVGDTAADTVVATLTNVSTVAPATATGMASSAATAESLLLEASAASHTDAAASLP